MAPLFDDFVFVREESPSSLDKSQSPSSLDKSLEQDKDAETARNDPDHENLINMTQKVLNRHRHRHQGQSHQGYRYHDRGPKTSKRKSQRGRNSRSKSKPDLPLAVAGPIVVDDKAKVLQVEVDSLRFSQKTCKSRFHCGRKVDDLVYDLLNQKVSLDADFLHLTVFEAVDHETNERILRCIDNRRLLALKTYASLIQEDVLININFFSMKTLTECQRFLQNSDDTAGLFIKVRPES